MQADEAPGAAAYKPVQQVIADAIAAAVWADGQPVIRLAAVHRERVAGEIVQAVGEAGYVLLSPAEFARVASALRDSDG